MSFLDRFKLQPRWKHADPAVRAAAVAELTDDPEHQRALVELAGSDEDVRVRRAALERLNSIEDLARFARADRDETLRRKSPIGSPASHRRRRRRPRMRRWR